MTLSEAQAFLSATVEVCPDYHPLFFTALRSGLRKSELIALRWGDIQFGESEDDNNRFIFGAAAFLYGALRHVQNS
jgi:integrase